MKGLPQWFSNCFFKRGVANEKNALNFKLLFSTPGLLKQATPASPPFDRLRAGFDKLRAGFDRLRTSGGKVD